MEGVRLCSPLAFPLWQALGRLPFSPSEHPRARWFNESKPHTAGFRLRLWLDTHPLFGRTGAGTKGLAHGHLHAGAAAVPVPQSCQGPGGTSVSHRRGPEWKSGTRSFAASSHSFPFLCAFYLRVGTQDWSYLRGGPVGSPAAQARAFSARASGPHPLFPIQAPRDAELSCVCLLCRLAFQLLFLHSSPAPPSLLSLTAYFAAAPRAPPPFSAESPWRLG